ncbi:hypothetical protein SAMN02787142_7207 [Burkholderia sp. WP9]|nr:hypothetical protein SAMN02787142_7207 [Burkholderia sp. WP9]
MFMCMLAYVRASPPDTMPRACIADNAMLRCIFTPYIYFFGVNNLRTGSANSHPRLRH